MISRTGKPALVPRVIGRVRRLRPVNVRDVQFLRANTDRQIKITVPGPFTMTKLAQNEYYASDAELAMDYAAAVNMEIRDLFAAGADIVQIDEPYMQVQPVEARSYGISALAASARWDHWDNRGSHLLWLRRDGQGEARAV